MESFPKIYEFGAVARTGCHGKELTAIIIILIRLLPPVVAAGPVTRGAAYFEFELSLACHPHLLPLHCLVIIGIIVLIILVVIIFFIDVMLMIASMKWPRAALPILVLLLLIIIFIVFFIDLVVVFQDFLSVVVLLLLLLVISFSNLLTAYPSRSVIPLLLLLLVSSLILSLSVEVLSIFLLLMLLLKHHLRWRIPLLLSVNPFQQSGLQTFPILNLLWIVIEFGGRGLIQATRGVCRSQSPSSILLLLPHLSHQIQPVVISAGLITPNYSSLVLIHVGQTRRIVGVIIHGAAIKHDNVVVMMMVSGNFIHARTMVIVWAELVSCVTRHLGLLLVSRGTLILSISLLL